MNLSKEKFLIKRHSERSHAVAKSKNLGRCVIASLVRGVAISCLLFLAACGDDPKVGGTEEDAGIIAIENKTVSGVSQKGPFVNGSSVKLYEMDGETLAPTGKSFPGKIASDDGRFTVPSISLASQYALLEANGYFRNEITGGKSNGTITLNALTDLSDREKVNINLLTHLEYERALYLVGTGVAVADAKKQAESEILDAFEIKGEFENSEDLDIFSSGDGNAALLAFSVLMLGNLTEADLTERLTNFATDVEQDGKWDDEKTKAVIADWASGMSLADGLAGIRNNIAGWNFSNEVPAFEKYVNNFWWQNYDLGTCDSKREGEILQASNLLSANNGVHFICNNAAWRVATDLEKDTYKWKAGKDADVKFGDVIKTNCYVFEDKTWRSGNESDCSLDLRGCTALRQDTVGLGKDKVWYICDMKNWRTAEDIEKDTATWGAGKFDGEVRAGQINKWSYYIYETSTKVWREAATLEKDTYDYKNNKDWTAGTDGDSKWGEIVNTNCYVFENSAWRGGNASDCSLGIRGCTALRQDTIGQGSDNVWYICKDKEWKDDTPLNPNIQYGTMIDSRDGQIYKTVEIGSQTWMAQNLNYNFTNNYDSDSIFYGKDYTWEQAQNVCDEGWHLPSKEEFEDLITGKGEGYDLAKKFLSLKSSYDVYDREVVGTDDYGFSAIRTRNYWYDKDLAFWSATESTTEENGAWMLTFGLAPSVGPGLWDYAEDAALKTVAHSVRCVKNEE